MTDPGFTRYLPGHGYVHADTPELLNRACDVVLSLDARFPYTGMARQVDSLHAPLYPPIGTWPPTPRRDPPDATIARRVYRTFTGQQRRTDAAWRESATRPDRPRHDATRVSIGPARVGWWFYRRAMRRCWRHDWA